MKSTIKKLLILLVVAAVFAGTWYAINQRQKAAQATPGGGSGGPAKPSPVVEAPVEARTFSSQISAVGTVRSDEAIEVSANVTETVEQLLFEDGGVVTNGQVLVILSSDEEEAAMRAAEANLAEHEREIKRLTDLVKQGAAPEVRLQERQTLAEIARQEKLEIRARLKDRRITAPFAGMLGLRRISPGTLIAPGTIITTLDRIDRVKLDFTVPEIFIRELKIGLKITARSASYPDEAFEGSVAHLDSRVDPVTRSIAVRAIFDNPGYRLRPGMLLTTTLEGGPRESASIPERAVISNAQNHYGFVIQEGENGLTVERRSLTLGRRIMGYVEVLSGVEIGERVAADGLLGLRTGSAVEIIGQFQGPAAPFQPTEGQSAKPKKPPNAS